MSTFWQLGRIGSMLIRLNYTWLIVGGLAVCYLAQVWLPPYLSGAAAWVLAVGLILLYGGGLLFAEAARTAAAGIFSPAWPRSVHLFPFGAAAAYPLRTLGAGRAVGAALVGPVVLALLGGIYGAAGSLLPGPTLMAAVLQALAFGHLAAAVLNLLPGLPLAGGWVLIGLWSWMSSDRESGLILARRLGLVAVLTLAGVGVVWILPGADWVPGLALLALAWAIREGGVAVERRASTRQVLETLTAAELMQPPARTVAPDATLAAVLWGTDKLAADAVVAVRTRDGRFGGLLPVALTDDILQGTWPYRPVRSVMIPAATFAVVRPDARLADVLVAFAQQQLPAESAGTAPRDLGYVPVVARGRLQGLISREQISEYEQLGAKVGVQEAAALTGLATPPRSRRAWIQLLAGGAVTVLALTLLARNATSPTRAASPVTPPLSGAITFSDHVPETNAVVGRRDLPITLVIDSPAPVLTVTMTLQGEALVVTLDPPTEGRHVTASAIASTVLLGPYEMQVDVQAEGGLTAHTSWGFRVVPGLIADDRTTPAAAVPTFAAPAATPEVTLPVRSPTRQ